MSVIEQRQPRYFGRQRLEFRHELMSPPTEPMWDAMKDAGRRFGMASRGEDPFVDELQTAMAELTGHESSLFLPTTTIATMLGIQALGVSGTQAIMESRCHIHWVEHFHISAIAGAAPLLIMGDKFGALPLQAIESALNLSYYDTHLQTGVICLENTHNICGGTVLSPSYTDSVAALAHNYDISLSLDGARVLNAAIAQGVPVRDLTHQADIAAVSLGKALGAPMGAVLCASEELLRKVVILARRTGTLAVHRAGIFAAAALVALEGFPERLSEDHRRARDLAEGVAAIDGLAVDLETVQTNMVRVNTAPSELNAETIASRVREHGLSIHVIEPYAFKMVTYHSITDEDVAEATHILSTAMSEALS